MKLARRHNNHAQATKAHSQSISPQAMSMDACLASPASPVLPTLPALSPLPAFAELQEPLSTAAGVREVQEISTPAGRSKGRDSRKI
jgi:hypothetical protein